MPLNLLRLRTKESFLSGGNGYLTAHLLTLNLAAAINFDREGMSLLIRLFGHPTSRAFRNSTIRKALCRSRVKPLLSVRKLLLVDSFKARLSVDRT